MKVVRLFTGSDQKSHFEEIEMKFTGNQPMLSTDTRDSLEKARLLQFAGEGIAEAIAQQVIDKAGGTPADEDSIGRDRFRQDLYQMVHVSDGRARVLIRG